MLTALNFSLNTVHTRRPTNHYFTLVGRTTTSRMRDNLDRQQQPITDFQRQQWMETEQLLLE